MAEGFDSLVVLTNQFKKRLKHLVLICPKTVKLPEFKITTDEEEYLKDIESYPIINVAYHITPPIGFDEFNLESLPFKMITHSYGIVMLNFELNRCRILKSRYDLFDDGIERNPGIDIFGRCHCSKEVYEDYLKHVIFPNMDKWYKIGS